MDSPEVIMERMALEDLPATPELPGWGIRGYQSGDDVHWTEIQREADQYNVITPILFDREFGHDERTLSQRVLFAWNDTDGAVGTAAAWWGTSAGDPWGRIHWVAVKPRFQGRSLGRALVIAACHRLLTLGHKHAYLTSATVRVQAIRLYLTLGFLPRLVDAKAREIWDDFADRTGDAVLGAFLKSVPRD